MTSRWVVTWSLVSGLMSMVALAERGPEMPYFFEQNTGQVNPAIEFLARRAGTTLLFSGNDMILRLAGGEEVRWRFTGTAPAPGKWRGERLTGVTVNSYVGKPVRWRQNIPSYASLRREGLYPGVDLVAYGKPGSTEQFEYDLVVRPGADTGAIAWEISDAEAAIDAKSGDIVIERGKQQFRHRKPVAYQESAGGTRIPVAATYRKLAGHRPGSSARFGLRLGDYDRSRPLIIDPVWTVAGYWGGSGDEAITFFGSRALCGYTASSDLPGGDWYESTGLDAFSMTLADGSTPSTLNYFGGSGDDKALGMAYATPGYVVVGETSSRDFPTGEILTRAGASPEYGGIGSFQTKYGGGNSDGFVFDLRRSYAGVILSGYLGGAGKDRLTAIPTTYDQGRILVAGETDSPDFMGAAQGGMDGFVSVLTQTQKVAYSSRFGGSGDETVIHASSVAVVGSTSSGSGFAGSGASKGGFDVYVQRLNPVTLEQIHVYRYGGSGDDVVRSVQVGGYEPGPLRVLFVGSTTSRDLPVELAWQTSYGGGSSDGFFAEILLPRESRDLSTLTASSYLGGSGADEILGFVSLSNDLVMVGGTDSRDFPIQNATQATYGGGRSDGFFTALRGNRMVYSTYAGGAGEDRLFGIAPWGPYFAWGWTDSEFQPVPQSAYYGRSYSGGRDLMVLKVDLADTPGALVAAPGLSTVLNHEFRQTRFRSSNPAKLLLSVDGRIWAAEVEVEGSPLPVHLNALSAEGEVYVEALTPEGATPTRYQVYLAPALLLASDRAYSTESEMGMFAGRTVRFPSDSKASIRLLWAVQNPKSLKYIVTFPRGPFQPVLLASGDTGILENPAAPWSPAEGRDVELLTGSRLGRTQLVVPPIPGLTSTETRIDIETEAPAPSISCPLIANLSAANFSYALPGARRPLPIRIEFAANSPVSLYDGGRVWNGQASAEGTSLTARAGTGPAGRYTITASGAGLQTVTVTCNLLPLGVTWRVPYEVKENSTFTASADLFILDVDGSPLSPPSSFAPDTRIPLDLEYSGGLEGPSRVEFASFTRTISFEVKAVAAGKGIIRHKILDIGPNPNPYARKEIAVVKYPAITLSSISVGKDTVSGMSAHTIEVTGPLRIRSGDPSRVLLSLEVAGEGVPEIQMGANGGTFFVQALGDAGDVPVIASSGSTTTTAFVRLLPTYVTTDSRADYAVQVWEPDTSLVLGFRGRGMTAGQVLGLRPGVDPGLTVVSSDPAVLEVGSPASGKPEHQGSFHFPIKARQAGIGRLRIESTRFPVDPAIAAKPFRVFLPELVLSRDVVPYQTVVDAAVESRTGRMRGLVEGTRLLLRSSDPSKFLLSTNRGVPGVASIEVEAGPQGIPAVFMHGIASGGVANLEIESGSLKFGPVKVQTVPSTVVFVPNVWNGVNSNQPKLFTNVALRGVLPGTGRPTEVSHPLRPGAPDVEVKLETKPVNAPVRFSLPRVVLQSGIAQVPLEVTWLPGSAGSNEVITVEASVSGFATTAQSTLRITPQVAEPLRLTLYRNNTMLGQEQMLEAFLQLNRPATEPIVVSLESSDPAVMLVAESDRSAGATSIQATIPAGASSTRFYVFSTGPAGSAELLMTPPAGVTADSTPMRFTVARSWLAPAINSNVLLGAAFRMSLYLQVAVSQDQSYSVPWAPRPGLPERFISLQASPADAIEVPAEGISLSRGYAELVALRGGMATITFLSQPEGFATPPVPPSTNVMVGVPEIRVQNPPAFALRDSMVDMSISFSSVDELRVRSLDATRLLVSQRVDQAPTTETTYSQRQGGVTVYLHVVGASGPAGVIVSGPNVDPITVTFPIRPGAFYWNMSGSNSLLFGASTSTSLAFREVAADGQILPNGYHRLRPGARFEVKFQSSNPQVLNVEPATVTVVGDSYTDFHRGPALRALTAGSARVTMTQPEGLTTPVPGPLSVEFTVTQGILSFTPPRVAVNMRSLASVRLNPAGSAANPVPLTVTSLDPGVLVVARSLGVPGEAAIQASVNADSARFYIEPSRGASAGARGFVRIEAPGYRTQDYEITVNPSGFVFESTSGTAQVGAPYAPRVALTPLSISTLQPISGSQDMTLSSTTGDVYLTVGSSNPALGLTGSPTLFPAGGGSVPIPLRFGAAGTTTLTIEPPPGFAKPLTGATQIVVVR